MDCKRLLIILVSITLLSSCKKEEQEPVITSPPTPAEDYHMTHKINGTTQDFQDDDSNYSFESSAYGSHFTMDGIECFTFETTAAGLSPNSGGNSGARIIINSYAQMYYNTYVNAKAEVLAFICDQGEYSYIEGINEKFVSIEAYYNSELYTSSPGPQPETSAFNVSESIAITGSGDSVTRNLKGTYSCRLYKQSNPSEFIDVTDGTFYLNFKAP